MKDFKKIVEEIKEDDMDPKKTKQYIQIIKRYVDKIAQNSPENERTKKEMYDEFLEIYDEENDNTLKSTRKLPCYMSQYDSYKELLKLSKGNEREFNKLLEAAKAKASSLEGIYGSMNLNEQMIASLAQIVRNSGKKRKNELVPLIQDNKADISGILKKNIISSIQRSVSFLNDFGFIDDYIEDSNESLKKLNLQDLSFERRNPIADEEYDSDGNRIVYDENEKITVYDSEGKLVKGKKDTDKFYTKTGVLDNFQMENLEKMSIEDLIFLDTFWQSKYLQERLELSKAMAVIRTLNLGDRLTYGYDKQIDLLEDDRITAALKKDLALTYLTRNPDIVSSKTKRQYNKFLKKNELSTETDLEDEILEEKKEIDSLHTEITDIILKESVCVMKLLNNSIKVKDWGEITLETDQAESVEAKQDSVVLAVSNPNFIGPLVMSVPRQALEDIFETKSLNLPKYKDESQIDYEYSKVMSKLYLPSNDFFRVTAKKLFDEDPGSSVRAGLAHKKAKTDHSER